MNNNFPLQPLLRNASNKVIEGASSKLFTSDVSREKKQNKTHQQHNRQQKASLLKQKQTRPFLTYSLIKTWGKGFNKKGLLTPTESAAVLSIYNEN